MSKTTKTPKTEAKGPTIKATPKPAVAKVAVAVKADQAPVTPAVAASTPPTPPKAKAEKRVVLNPQYVLDAKAAALKEIGIKLAWAGRAWHAGDKTFTSLEMSKYSVEEFAALFPVKT